MSCIIKLTTLRIRPRPIAPVIGFQHRNTGISEQPLARFNIHQPIVDLLKVNKNMQSNKNMQCKQWVDERIFGSLSTAWFTWGRINHLDLT